jgi:hypothetical protein
LFGAVLARPTAGRRVIRLRETAEPMCNLYSMTRAQDAMRKLFGVKNDRTGNLPSLPGIFASPMRHTYLPRSHSSALGCERVAPPTL